jgi:hypothetical protein
MKKVICIPHFIGDMKYFEALMPIMKDSVRFAFVFIPKTIQPTYLEEMIQYSNSKKYPYALLGAKQIYKNKFLDLIFQIPLWYVYRKECKKLIQSESAYGILATTDTGFYHHCLFTVANSLGVKTFVFQWAPIAPPNIRSTAKIEALKIQQLKMPPLKKFFKLFLYKYNNGFVRHISALLGFDTKKLPIMGLGPSRKLGVINNDSYKIYKDAGVPENKMSIIGSLDFDQAVNAMKLFNSDVHAKNRALKKYGINPNKINVALYTTPFNAKDITILNNEEQTELYYKIAETIRTVFKKDAADILLKIHPAENTNIYKPLEELGVKIYGKDTKNEEFIYFVDLYISSPSTSNYIPITMGKDAIFINFLKAPSILVDPIKEAYGIKKVISDKAEFIKLLNDFKLGKLQRQYTDEHIIRDGRCRERIREWLLS